MCRFLISLFAPHMAKLSPPFHFDFSLLDACPAWKQLFSLLPGLGAEASRMNRSRSRRSSTGWDPNLSMSLPNCSSWTTGIITQRWSSSWTPTSSPHFHQRALFEQCLHCRGETVEQFVFTTQPLVATSKASLSASLCGAHARSPSGQRASAGRSRN